MTVTVVGTGAAGAACARLLAEVGVGDIIGVDRDGVLHRGLAGLSRGQAVVRRARQPRRPHRRHPRRRSRAPTSLLGLSGPGIVEPWMLTDMADDAIVFAMANPTPEVMPGEVPANVAVVATGRSDFPNQINNVLAFPGVFRGLLDTGAPRCTHGHEARRGRRPSPALVPEPTADRIVPGAFDPACVADAVRRRPCAGVAAERRRCAERREPTGLMRASDAAPGRDRSGGRARRSCWRAARGASHAPEPAPWRTAGGGRGGRAGRWPRPTRQASASTWAYSARTPVT